jgi:two-component system, NarL family, sensor histidine kinase ComP
MLAGWWRRVTHPHLISFVFLSLLLIPIFSVTLHRPDPGAIAERSGEEWIVTEVTLSGVAARAGLEVGDRVVALDGEPPSVRRRTDPDLDLTVANAWTIDRQGARLTLTPDWDRGSGQGSGEPVALLVIALAFLGIGTLVQLLKREDGLPGEFYRLCLAVAVILGLSAEAGSDVVWARVINVGAFSLLPAIFLRFCLWFAEDAPPQGATATAVRGLTILGILAGLAYLLTGFAGLAWFYAIRAATMALLAVGVLGGLVALLRAYLYPRSVVTRQQIRIVVFGTGLALIPLVTLSVVPIALGHSEVVRPQLLAIGLALLPLSIAYAILRHRIMGIEIVIERTLVSGTMTLLLAGLYALFLYGPNLVGRSGTEPPPLLLLTFFALITLTFVPVRDAVNHLIDHFIYHDRYDYLRVLKGFGSQLASVQPIDETLSRVAAGLSGAMNLRGAAVLVYGPDDDLVERAVCGDRPSVPDVGRPADAAPALTPGAIRTPDSGCQAPLIAHGEALGLLCLGAKRSHADFSAQDLSLVEAIASQAAIAIANALLVERLQAKVAELELMRDSLLHVAEEERKRLAQDIHDGALHTVLDLVRRTEGLIDNLPVRWLDHAETADRFRSLVERGRDAAHELRSLCSELYPSELVHLGLFAAIESLAQRISRDENLVVHFTVHGYGMEHRLPEEMEDTLYRATREALDNACRHASASFATIDLYLDESRVSLVVRDLGRGFVVPSRFGTLLRRGHLGLVSIRERVERLGGEFVVESALGKGTTLRASLPLEIEAPDKHGLKNGIPLPTASR